MSRVVDNAINTAQRLDQRLACNGAASSPFQRFVRRLLAVRRDDCALEIGTGLGAQLLYVAGRARRVTGVDISAELLRALRQRVTSDNVRTVHGDMDRLDDLHLRGPFTLAYSVFSIYYSREPSGVVRALARLLADEGARCVVIAPDVDNNADWYADLGRLYRLPRAVFRTTRVCRDVVLPTLLDLFPSVQCTTFRNDVSFDDLDELMRYYDACAPYCRPDRRDQARAFFKRRLARDGSYRISKHVLGVVGGR